MIQTTLIQIDNYGPWTVTPTPRREASLQILQASLYADLQRLFCQHKAVVFPMNYDNHLAVTNGMSPKDHKEIKKRINQQYPVSVSMAIASAEKPFAAQQSATDLLAKRGGAQHPERKGELLIDSTSKDRLQVAHIDINDVTTHTNENTYQAYQRVMNVFSHLQDSLVKQGALIFFMGGDNYITPTPEFTLEDFEQVFVEVEETAHTSLKAGVGHAANAEEAIHHASMGLAEIRAGADAKIIFKP